MPHPNYSSTPPPSPPPPHHPPTIGKIGPYTVFVTPPATAKPSPLPSPSPSPSAAITTASTTAPPPPPPRPPVQLPPIQYPTSPVDRFAFLRHSLLKLQHVHASVDEYMANWLGLDQSKYQWALNDYYQAHPLEKGDVLTKEVPKKSLTV